MLAVLTVVITFNVAGLPRDPVTVHRVVPGMGYCQRLGDHVVEGSSDAHRYGVSCAPLHKAAKRRLWDVY